MYTLMAKAATRGADQHIRSSLGLSILPKDTPTSRAALNQRPSDNKALALPLIHSCPQNVILKGNVSYLPKVLDTTQSVFTYDAAIRQHSTNKK